MHYKSIFFGISAAIAASASYALISPENTEPAINKPLQATAVFSDPATPIIENPVLSTKTPIEQQPAEPLYQSVNHKIKSGENLSSIFSKLNLSKTDLHHIINANKTGKQFADIKPGKELTVKKDKTGQLQQLVYKQSAVNTLQAIRMDETFDVQIISKPIERQITSTQATINTSLFIDGKNAGLPDKTIMQLANIFAWDIDFALNLRKGDQFTVVYEKLFVDGKNIDTGNIISAEFINQDHSYTAVRFEDKKGNTSYYTPDGKSMRKAFLRTPVDFARISSGFNLKRKHPVLNRIRAHKGVDYAARTGTPIKTTGDGKIIYRGRKGGYGRVVIVQHGQKYSSLYAHMSNYKRGQKVGSYVKQGQVIGYIGQSGLATGPHLHYEFRVNGVHRNPLTVKLPNAEPIKSSLLAEFKNQTEPLLEHLAKAKASTLLAQNQN